MCCQAFLFQIFTVLMKSSGHSNPMLSRCGIICLPCSVSFHLRTVKLFTVFCCNTKLVKPQAYFQMTFFSTMCPYFRAANALVMRWPLLYRTIEGQDNNPQSIKVLLGWSLCSPSHLVVRANQGQV